MPEKTPKELKQERHDKTMRAYVRAGEMVIKLRSGEIDMPEIMAANRSEYIEALELLMADAMRNIQSDIRGII
jgi:hypothetical protein